jgi:chemotaxis-related protein WspB
VLFLVFQLDRDRYAIDAAQVVSVLNLVEPKAIPLAPAAVAGAFDYRGEPVPLIDLCQLALGRPARARLSTRVIVVDYPAGDGGSRRLGLIAEQVLETVRREAAEFAPAGVDAMQAPYLGPVASDAQGLLQWVRIEQLLPDSVRELLFQASTESA